LQTSPRATGLHSLLLQMTLQQQTPLAAKLWVPGRQWSCRRQTAGRRRTSSTLQTSQRATGLHSLLLQMDLQQQTHLAAKLRVPGRQWSWGRQTAGRRRTSSTLQTSQRATGLHSLLLQMVLQQQTPLVAKLRVPGRQWSWSRQTAGRRRTSHLFL